MTVASTLSAWISTLLGLGLEPGTLAVHHVVLRGIVVYAAGVAMVRLAPRRFMGRHTPFDFILGIILGAVLARAINGTGPFVPTLAGAFVLVLTDRLFAAGAFRWGWFRRLVEGTSLVLVRDGQPDLRALRRSHLNEDDLEAALRTQGFTDPREVSEARIERSGEFTAVPSRG